jgi:N-acetylglucosaminyl-diphospho-decaprenol L-rhamnosyltransferase
MTARDEMMDLSVVIVSYNTRPLLVACLESLRAARQQTPADKTPDASKGGDGVEPACLSSPTGVWRLTTGVSERSEVFVVDNASTDDSAAAVRTQFPEVRLIASEINRGFAGANNLALPLCRGRYVMLLNPDTEVASDALAALVEFMDLHPEVGAVGPRLLNPDGTLQPSGHPFPTLAGTAVRLLLCRPLAPSRGRKAALGGAGTGSAGCRQSRLCRAKRQAPSAKRRAEGAERHDWLTGACLMVRRAVLEEVGPLDERFFFWWEDVDWCHRIRAASWEICLVPGARVTHLGAASGIGYSLNALRAQEGQCYYFRKHHGRAAERAMRALFSCYHLLGWLKYSVRAWLRRDSGDRLKQRVHRLGVCYSLSSRPPAWESSGGPWNV